MLRDFQTNLWSASGNLDVLKLNEFSGELLFGKKREIRGRLEKKNVSSFWKLGCGMFF